MRSQEDNVLAVSPSWLTMAENGGALGLGDTLLRSTAWQPPHEACANARPGGASVEVVVPAGESGWQATAADHYVVVHLGDFVDGEDSLEAAQLIRKIG